MSYPHFATPHPAPWDTFTSHTRLPFVLTLPCEGPAQRVVIRDVQVPLRKTPPDSRFSG